MVNVNKIFKLKNNFLLFELSDFRIMYPLFEPICFLRGLKVGIKNEGVFVSDNFCKVK